MFIPFSAKAPIPSNARVAAACQSRASAYEISESELAAPGPLRTPTATMRSGSSNGSPSTAPSQTMLSRPSVVPVRTTTRLASVVLSPISTPGFDDRERSDLHVVAKDCVRTDGSKWVNRHKRVLLLVEEPTPVSRRRWRLAAAGQLRVLGLA